MFGIKTLIFVEKTVCASFVLSRKNHGLSFLFRRTSPYPFFVDATAFSNIICIFSFKIQYAQCIHRNFVFFTLMGTFMPHNHLYGNVNIFKVYHFYLELWLELYQIKRQTFICIKLRRISLINLIGMSMFS